MPFLNVTSSESTERTLHTVNDKIHNEPIQIYKKVSGPIAADRIFKSNFALFFFYVLYGK